MSDNDDPSVRDWLAALIAPLVPAEWVILPNQRMPETIAATTVILKHSKITKLPEAPSSSLSNAVVVTIASPLLDHSVAENALDGGVLTLVTALDSSPRLIFVEAEKVLVPKTYLGWDITINVITQKES